MVRQHGVQPPTQHCWSQRAFSSCQKSHWWGQGTAISQDLPRLPKTSHSKGLKARSRHLSTEWTPEYRGALGPKSTPDHDQSQIHWAKRPDLLLSEEDAEADIRTTHVVSACGDHWSAVTRVSPSQEILWTTSRNLQLKKSSHSTHIPGLVRLAWRLQSGLQCQGGAKPGEPLPSKVLSGGCCCYKISNI